MKCVLLKLYHTTDKGNLVAVLAIKAYGGVHVVQLHASADCHRWDGIEGWLAPRYGLDSLEKRGVINPCRASNHIAY